jgi:hypothetical protein
VAATLSVATSHTDRRALARDDLEALIVCSGIDFEALNAGADSDRLASVVLITPVDELDVFQVVHPERQGTCTGTLASEVMASVVDDQANVVVFGKLQASGYIS